MILVPEDRAELVDYLSDLYSQMEQILLKKDLIENEKAIRYLQVRQKFDKIQHPEEEKTEANKNQETVIPENQESETVPEEDAVTTEIYNAAPLQYFDSVQKILDFMKANNSKLTWTF
ncbi:hypothetical protein AVEN_98664-1 [Araneus ventricosus]|uniref:Uncharacterized protein n=1 Tax=Araneus ventricosus TaxID=182803 RepID=A0A4Y2TNN2_ARAVE|nr:hypothetical protein AVEN_98664-1 [Araneus ventricosus]